MQPGTVATKLKQRAEKNTYYWNQRIAMATKGLAETVVHNMIASRPDGRTLKTRSFYELESPR